MKNVVVVLIVVVLAVNAQASQPPCMDVENQALMGPRMRVFAKALEVNLKREGFQECPDWAFLKDGEMIPTNQRRVGFSYPGGRKFLVVVYSYEMQRALLVYNVGAYVLPKTRKEVDLLARQVAREVVERLRWKKVDRVIAPTH